MTAEPKRRADGRCACGCGKRLKRPATPVAKRLVETVPRDPYALEPFATRECCERFYGISRSGRPLDDD